MEDQRKIIELLTELRDLQKAHFEYYRQFTNQVAEDSKRERSAAQQLTDELQAMEQKHRTRGIILWAVAFLFLLFFAVVVLLQLFGMKH